MGEELFHHWGVPDDRRTWSSRALAEERFHEAVVGAHRAFLTAGAEVVTTSNFACTAKTWGGSLAEARRLTEVAGRLARQAVHEQQHGRGGDGEALVAGCLPPLSECYRADLILDYDEGVRQYTELIAALDPYVDLFLGETMSGVGESTQVVDALALARNVKPIWLSFALNELGALRSGEPARDAVKFASTQKHCAAVLFNCSSPEAITLALQDVKAAPPQPLALQLGAYPNRLTPVAPTWTMASSSSAQPFRTDLDSHRFVTFARRWRSEFGVTILGGCCGMFPDDIACLRREVE